ncbi:MAG: DUF6907 domain-containing protein [Acidimicrobiales bacterium]
MADERARTDKCPSWCAGGHQVEDAHMSDLLERLTVSLADGEETIVRVELSQDPGGRPSVVISIGDDWGGCAYMRSSDARRLAQALSEAAVRIDRKASQPERMAPRVRAARNALREWPNAHKTMPCWEEWYGIAVEKRTEADVFAAKGDRAAAKSLRLEASHIERSAVQLVETLTPRILAEAAAAEAP